MLVQRENEEKERAWTWKQIWVKQITREYVAEPSNLKLLSKATKRSENKIIKFAVCFTECSRKWNAYETLIISIIIRRAREKSLFCKQIYDDSRNVRNFLISQRRENLNQT